MPLENIRSAKVAGSFYPADFNELNNTLNQLISFSDQSKSLKALIVPHAGYAYSGKVAGQVFGYLKNNSFNKVIVIGPSHYYGFNGFSVADFDYYETPLGKVKVSFQVKDLIREEHFSYQVQAHDQEHAIEIELPFLQKTLNNFELIPIIAGQNNLTEIEEVSNVLKKYIDDQTLIVFSVDFTHYGPSYGFVPFTDDMASNLDKLDQPVVEYLTDFKTNELHNYLTSTAQTNDGEVVLTLASFLLAGKDYNVELVAKDSSGQIMNDYTNSVSYYGLIVSLAEELSTGYTDQEKEFLLKLSRNTLNKYYEDGSTLTISESLVPKRLKEERGVFVTLEKNGNLRGCIGYILPNGPIYQAVIENTLNAALDDPRFDPVEAEELNSTKIEISILSLPEELAVNDSKEYLVELRPLIDGVVLKQSTYQATYLPQVWEDLKEPEMFLNSLCQKAGLKQKCWQDSNTKLLIYQAEVFHQ